MDDQLYSTIISGIMHVAAHDLDKPDPWRAVPAPPIGERKDTGEHRANVTSRSQFGEDQ